MSFRTTCDRCVRHEASSSGSEPCEQHVWLSLALGSEFAFAYIAVELGNWLRILSSSHLCPLEGGDVALSAGSDI